jgi:hypothetical protein
VGSISAAFVATVLRFLIGEPLISLPMTFQFPVFDDEDKNPKVPVKTILMLISLFVLLSVSWIRRKVVNKKDQHHQEHFALVGQ